jgi:DNA repair exonuclease SbcCD ATPase subunit
MPIKTVLPSLELTKNLWNGCSKDQLIQSLMYIWGLYRVLLGSYQELLTEKVHLRELLATAEKRAAAAEECAAAAEKHTAAAEKRASAAEKHTAAAEKRAAAAEKHAASAQERAAAAEEHAAAADERAAAAEEHAAAADERADEADQYAAKIDRYADKLEHELGALHAQQKAEEKVCHEFEDDRSWISVSKRNSFKDHTKALVNSWNDLEKCKRENSELRRKIVKYLSNQMKDCITQDICYEPVIVVSSLEEVDPIFLSKNSAMSCATLMGNKFPTAQNTFIKKVHKCASLRSIFDCMNQIINLCSNK